MDRMSWFWITWILLFLLVLGGKYAVNGYYAGEAEEVRVEAQRN